MSDGAGNVTATNRYHEYGVADGGVTGRFGYTGQMWLPETGLYSYKARMYSAQLGRFLQADPIGYAGGMNLYAYVAGDPVNFTDPTGLIDNYTSPDVVVEHPRWLGLGSIIGGGFGDGTCGTLSANAGFLQECIGAGGTAAAAGSGPAQGNVGDRTAQDRKRPWSGSCARALQEPGRIEATASQATATIGIGWSYSSGEWRNTKTGTYGTYSTLSFNAGLDFGFSLGGTWANRLSDFVGSGEGWSVGISIGPMGLAYGRSYDLNGNRTGSAAGAGVGGVGRFGGSTSFGETRIGKVCHYAN